MAETSSASDPVSAGRAWFSIVVAVGLALALLLVNLLQLASLLLRPFSRSAFRAVNRWFANTWWGWCVLVAERLNGFRVVTSGDPLPAGENAIVVANHQQMPDIVVIMALARRCGRLGDLKFFVKRALKWVPGIGWGMQFLDCVFVHRDWAADVDSIERTFRSLVRDRVPMWMVSFVEGTRITPAKLARSRTFAADRGLEPPRHVLLPRPRGFAATVRGLRDHAEAVYDLTIAYSGPPPTLWQLVGGSVQDVRVHARRFPVSELPVDDRAVRDWLLGRFRHKDDLLDHFHASGTFPG